jgi:hypothetical protein
MMEMINFRSTGFDPSGVLGLFNGRRWETMNDSIGIVEAVGTTEAVREIRAKRPSLEGVRYRDISSWSLSLFFSVEYHQ